MEPKNLEQVWDACKAAFYFIPDDFINELSESMPNLMAAVQQPKGSQGALCKFNKENLYSLICLLSRVFGLLVDSLLYFQFPTWTHLILSSTLFSSRVLANNLLANQPLFLNLSALWSFCLSDFHFYKPASPLLHPAPRL